jgi:hypothetical protein
MVLDKRTGLSCNVILVPLVHCAITKRTKYNPNETRQLVKIHSREKSKLSSYNHEFFRVPGAGGELI